MCHLLFYEYNSTTCHVMSCHVTSRHVTSSTFLREAQKSNLFLSLSLIVAAGPLSLSAFRDTNSLLLLYLLTTTNLISKKT
mmetsp:Transcript_1131/g.1213  ORF Transcript_1131/g.1213 Transcript_1131/m.1213 type:complete len:81 (+) Transcript_1131:386-628(+)